MIRRLHRAVPWLVVTVVAVAALVLFSAPATSPTTVSANAAVCGDNPTTNRRIEPYKCEHNDGRYTSGSTDKTYSVPCSMPKPWPASVVSCYGPGPVPAAAPAPTPVAPPAPPRADPPPATVPAGGGGAPAAPTARHEPKPAPSCG